jgi:CheY-like chemotaxis protein
VLVVEDEEPVRLVAVRALRALGYAVLEAADGAAALARSAAHAGAIDLLLTDVVMPGASGPEVARALAAARPSLRVLFMSGYTERAARSRGRLPPGASLVEKPLTLDALGRAVRAALDAPAQGNSTTRQ